MRYWAPKERLAKSSTTATELVKIPSSEDTYPAVMAERFTVYTTKRLLAFCDCYVAGLGDDGLVMTLGNPFIQ